jgi:hypothetical protein
MPSLHASEGIFSVLAICIACTAPLCPDYSTLCHQWYQKLLSASHLAQSVQDRSSIQQLTQRGSYISAPASRTYRTASPNLLLEGSRKTHGQGARQPKRRQ